LKYEADIQSLNYSFSLEIETLQGQVSNLSK